MHGLAMLAGVWLRASEVEVSATVCLRKDFAFLCEVRYQLVNNMKKKCVSEMRTKSIDGHGSSV